MKKNCENQRLFRWTFEHCLRVTTLLDASGSVLDESSHVDWSLRLEARVGVPVISGLLVSCVGGLGIDTGKALYVCDCVAGKCGGISGLQRDVADAVVHNVLIQLAKCGVLQ